MLFGPRIADFGRGRSDSLWWRSRRAYIEFLERALGGAFIAPIDHRPQLSELFTLARAMVDAGLIKEMPHKGRDVWDEPRIYRWGVLHAETESAGGMSGHSEYAALIAALAEGAERSIWVNHSDALDITHDAHESALAHAISPLRFVGFTDAQRREHPKLNIAADATFDWARGYSWTQRAQVHVPAQVVSRKQYVARLHAKLEPLIRTSITTGLATGPTRLFALLGGALEVIERDAFMIMWLNQISMPRIPPSDIIDRNPRVADLLRRCDRYGLQVAFVRLLTDAPTYVVAAVISDPRAMPPVTIGMSAHYDAGRAAEKALLEAMRARSNMRYRFEKHPDVRGKAANELVHWERGIYWFDPSRKHSLSFLGAGPVRKLAEEAWDRDTQAQHFQRIADWCRSAGYELASVSFTNTAKNVTPWHIEFVVIPELQPLHQRESLPCIGGRRLSEIPHRFGFTPLATPFTSEPHPFI